MIPFKTFSSLASKVGDLLSGETYSSTDDRQNAAGQRKDLDITKSQEAQLSEELGNVVRVPSTDGTGVSQAPAIAAPGTGGVIASKQPRAALQGGEASPPDVRAASSPSRIPAGS